MPYRKSLLLIILILPYFHGCQVYPSVIFYDHPFQITPHPFSCTPMSNQIPKLKTNTQNSKPNLMWLKIQYIYDHERAPTFFCTPAPGASPKIGSPGKVKKKKTPFLWQEKIFSSFLDKRNNLYNTDCLIV